MKNTLGSRNLFLKQVSNHYQMLERLLEAKPYEKLDENFMEKCIVSTKMLAGSASLLFQDGWEDFLLSYESLLIKYRDHRQPWDERIAQITSEIIEKEESLAGSTNANGGESDPPLLPPAEIRSLIEEINVLIEMEEYLEPQDNITESKAVENERQPGSVKQQAEALAIPAKQYVKVSPPESMGSKGLSSGRMFSVALASSRRLIEEIESCSGQRDGDDVNRLSLIEKEAKLISFYARSMIENSMPTECFSDNMVFTNLDPLKSAMEEYAQVLSDAENRTVDIGFLGEENPFDPELLAAASEMLKSLITDICRRCNEAYLHIEIEVEERNGCLFWKIRDNGENFLTDSRLDGDDFLAFYPGLIKTRKALNDCHSVLWVEPNEDHDTRFAFTLPVSLRKNSFCVWGGDKGRFAVLCSQVCRIAGVDEVAITGGVDCESVQVDGRWLPLIKLSFISSGAPEEGDTIVVIGSLEKRMAFYVQGEMSCVEGAWIKGSMKGWNGLSTGVMQSKDIKVPVLEAGALINNLTGVLCSGMDEDISGGVFSDQPNLSQSQARPEKEFVSPPDKKAAPDEVDVIVVERSEVLRGAFAQLFRDHNVKAKIFDHLDDAIGFLNGSSPAVIVSEFRTPSMAAKTLVETIQESGKAVPVFVTTAHNGDKAELLASKLGAAGYIVKPLNQSAVMDKLKPFLRFES